MTSWNEKLSIVVCGALLIAGSLFINKALTAKKQPEKVVDEHLASSADKLAQHVRARSSAMKKSPKKVLRQPAQVQLGQATNTSSKSTLFNKLKNIESCYQRTGECGFPQTDPKSEYFAIGQKLKKEILNIANKAIENDEKSAELIEIGQHFLKVPDGHVKKAALHLIASQDVDEKSLDLILSEIISYHDARLVEHAMLELTRYLGSPNEGKIHQSLSHAMRSGSPLVAQEIPNHLQPFVNRSSLSNYQSTLRTLSLGSLPHTRLKNVIESFIKLANAA